MEPTRCSRRLRGVAANVEKISSRRPKANTNSLEAFDQWQELPTTQIAPLKRRRRKTIPEEHKEEVPDLATSSPKS
ncbi:MAG: hypothetical protein CL912_15710 [Deltaproteobacteria bacterium]|nr:hypothetical protein [Deltaproteobacteria bacterium]